MAYSQAAKSRGILCPCGAGVCPLLTSKTPKNPGRQFYRCSANRCRFFKWLDQVESHEFVDIPICACGAGICQIETVATGPNAGRHFYACPIRKGQGACNYFQWQDDSQTNATMSSPMDESFSTAQSILTISAGSSPSNNYEAEKGEQTDLGHKMESFILETPPCCRSLVPTSSLLKSDNTLEEVKGSDYTSDESARKQRVRGGVSESNGTDFGSPSNCWAMLQSNFDHSLTKEPAKYSFLAREMEVNEKMKELRSQSSVREPVLADAFPSSDPISVSKQVKLCDNHVPASSVGSSAVCTSLLCTQKGSVMTESISKAFAKAAKQLQKDLLAHLKSMDIQDYETMFQEANSTFAALDQLKIDHRKFSGQVKEFICYASLLAKIDQCILNDHSCQLLLDWFNSEKMRLQEISDTYANGVEACLASRQQLMLLSEEVSHLKEKLARIESELSMCKAENLALEARIAEIEKEKRKVWQTFQIALKELEKGYEFRKAIEAEKIIAKAAFEKAKMVLWG